MISLFNKIQLQTEVLFTSPHKVKMLSLKYTLSMPSIDFTTSMFAFSCPKAYLIKCCGTVNSSQ